MRRPVPLPARPSPLRGLLALVLALVALLLAAPPASAAPEPVPGRPATAPYDDGTYVGLTPRQAEIVLDLVDDACGDTWCEGDLAFDFRAFSCDAAARTCVLRARLARWDREPLRWCTRTGTVHGFTRFGQMVERRDDGSPALRWEFYLAVSDAVHRMEQRVP